uniref:snRNAactivating protein complex subunit 3 putative n=1 Tax=Albugo laibachii Nc14 TaxID=890382 RepID=F0VZQ4_9STRA|nr:snRNAactivating protein complex subunit 3 putative [Albugo laibachii Nc14]|eukprot:CCA14275.1 snRNAactivating protein complex subunit 3 putative [Albugo laibachii Nc14]
MFPSTEFGHPNDISLSEACNSQNTEIDIATDDIQLPPLECAVDESIHNAMHQWNEYKSAQMEDSLSYMERIKLYRSIARCVFYKDMNPSSEDEEKPKASPSRLTVDCENPIEGVKTSDVQIKMRKKSFRRNVRKMERYQRIFGSLTDIRRLRAERCPSSRLQAFLQAYPPKYRVLQQKRSSANTATAETFFFARPDEPIKLGSAEHTSQATPVATYARRLHANRMSEIRQENRTENGEMIVWMDVLHPSKEPNKTQSFLVLGSQKLTSLIDQISCSMDQRFTKHKITSKMLYFGGSFYVDCRSHSTTNHVDYSLPIRKWIASRTSRKNRFGPPDGEVDNAPRSMEQTRFDELSLHQNLEGVFIHQGECEHFVLLRNVRMLHEYDTNASASFPMRLRNHLPKPLRNCLICKQFAAKFVCYEDRLATSEPMFFCDRCYKSAHCDPDTGDLLYNDFESFPFIQE